MRSHLSLFSILAVTAICVSCGGGGGGSDGAGGVVNTNQALTLTSSNAAAVSGLTIDAVGGGVTAGSLGTVVIASADSPNGSGFEFNLLQVARNVVDRVWTMHEQGTLAVATVGAAQVPESIDCSAAGTVSALWNDRDPVGELSERDFIVLTFNGCTEEDLTLNGEMDVRVQSLVGDPATDLSWTVVFRLNFNTLTASDSETLVEVVGTLDTTVDTQASGSVVTDITTEVATGPGETVSSFLYFGEREDFIELTLYNVRFQENTDGSFAVSGQGTLESSFIGGTVTFETTQEVTGTGFDVNNPSAGRVLIVGAANSNVLLRILDSVVVEMDLDDDGDGFDSGDVTLPSSWDDLNAAVDAL
ncbi:MAG: hypothetical protein V2I56_24790 [Desulfobacteraceae bacterium]|jgi:hypothetical protein|nr:hypothetical protein [Desulfobacteraceae bacterium]